MSHCTRTTDEMASTETVETDLERSRRLADAYADLESDLCDMHNMSLLVWDTVGDAIGNDESAQTGNRDLHYVPWQNVEKTMFAVGHLLNMLSATKDKFHTTMERKRTGSAAT